MSKQYREITLKLLPEELRWLVDACLCDLTLWHEQKMRTDAPTGEIMTEHDALESSNVLQQLNVDAYKSHRKFIEDRLQNRGTIVEKSK